MMDAAKITKYASDLVQLAALLQGGTPSSPVSFAMFFFNGQGQLGLFEQDAQRFQELTGEVYRESRWSEKYSESFVADKLRKVLGDLHSENTTAKAENALRGIASEYDAYNKQHTVLVPLFGIAVSLPSYSVGQVTLLQLTADDLKKRLGRNAVTQFGQGVVERLSGTVVAEYSVVAEPLRAKERAVEETRRALEVLRYAIPFVYPDGFKTLGINVGIYGEAPDSECMVTILPTHDDSSMTFTSENMQPAIPFRIKEDSKKTLAECGALEIANLLGKPTARLTDLEKVILRGVHWFGNALCQDEPENELLSLTTCLETFLTPRDGNPIGTAIAEGVCLLLGSEVNERKKIKKRVRELYGKRSGVSHGGEKAVLQSDLNELREIAKNLIKHVVGHKQTITSQKELLEMIEDRKLG